MREIVSLKKANIEKSMSKKLDG